MARLLRLDATILQDGSNLREAKEWDSLRHMELVVAVEERWGVILTHDEIVGIRSIGDIGRALRAHGVSVDQ